MTNEQKLRNEVAARLRKVAEQLVAGEEPDGVEWFARTIDEHFLDCNMPGGAEETATQQLEPDGEWPSEIENVCWGLAVVHQRCVETARRPLAEGDYGFGDYDDFVEYGLIDVDAPREHCYLGRLKVWVGEVDWVIAESRERALEVIRSVYDDACGSDEFFNESQAIECLAPGDKLTVTADDGSRQTLPACDWAIKEGREKHLASSEF